MKHQNRLDLSNWLTHFVHSNNPKNAPVLKDGFNATYSPDYEQLMKFVDNQNNYIELCKQGLADDDNNLDCICAPFSLWKGFEEDDEPFADNSSPLQVLKRILKTAYIRAGWSFRSGRPTIYGKRAACCFTEMPLYALLEYAHGRSDATTVSPYGIAFDRNELFKAGARPVIYGLTRPHREESNEDGWPRILSESCGIGEQEQFRYVATAEDGKIDWTHEREWRWPFDRQNCECPGLPVFLEDSPFTFSTILVFVPSRNEADEILDLLKLMYDSESLNIGEWQYDLNRIKNTRVLSLEEALDKIGTRPLENLRFEDIPLHSIRQFVRPIPSEETIVNVRLAISEARVAASKSGDFFRKTFPETWHFPDFGCAFLICTSSQSDFMAAMDKVADDEQLRITPSNEAGYDGYQIEGIAPRESTSRGTVHESVCVVRGVITALKKHFPEVEFVIREHAN